MKSSEFAHAANFPSTEALQYALAHNLLPSDLPGENTQKYLLSGWPDLIVRINAEASLQDVQQILSISHELEEIGVPVVPAVGVPFGAGGAVVAKRVNGISLEEALSEKPAAELLAAYDSIYAKICGDTLTRKRNHDPIMRDIYNPDQFMLGTIPGETEERVWLVDLSDDITLLHDDTLAYCTHVLELGNGVIETERRAGQNMPCSREAMHHIIEEMSDSTPYAAKVKEVARKALELSVPIHAFEIP